MDMYPAYPDLIDPKIILELKTKMNKSVNTLNQAKLATVETAPVGAGVSP
jgi:hypothetical protein